jgi:16S rRNA (guanine1207-N2)-methyltransferase
MTSSRLSFALEAPDALPADGLVAVFGPAADTDLSALPRDRVAVVQGFRPDHDAWAAAGYAVTPRSGQGYAAAIVCIPRARAAARDRVARAVGCLPMGATVWVDGAKTDGIDPLLRDLRARVPLSDPIAKAHGKAARFASPGPAAFADWLAADRTPAPGFIAPPGAFSADAPDPGSVLLATALPPGLKGRVADLGAGWGYLAAAILSRPGVTECHLIEADHAALDAARQNITDPRASFHWADARSFRLAAAVDAVVMNPPFHEGRKADPALGTAFIRAAAAMLKPGGALWMVANRHLPYEPALKAAFREVREVAGTGAFKVVIATHPQRTPASATAGRRPR